MYNYGYVPKKARNYSLKHNMTHLKSILAVSVALLALAAAGTAAAPSDQTVRPAGLTYDPMSTMPELSRPQRAWLGALEWCESRGNPKAVNPKDLDGTPSYGILQFKPGTFWGFAKKYNLTLTNYMDPDQQEIVIGHMLLHKNDINWRQQFPACVKKAVYTQKYEKD